MFGRFFGRRETAEPVVDENSPEYLQGELAKVESRIKEIETGIEMNGGRASGPDTSDLSRLDAQKLELQGKLGLINSPEQVEQAEEPESQEKKAA